MNDTIKPLVDTAGIDFSPVSLYDRYGVTIKMREFIYGGQPKNPETIKAWIQARTKPKGQNEPFDDALTEAQVKEALETMTEEVAEGMWTGFPKDDNGFYVETRCIKAMLRESATMLQYMVKKRGSKQVFQHGMEPKGLNNGSRVYFGKMESEGYKEGPIHVMTAQGPRAALKRQDFFSESVLNFDVWVFKTHPQENRHIGQKELVEMLRFAQENGLGASRSQLNGKFDVIGFKIL